MLRTSCEQSTCCSRNRMASKAVTVRVPGRCAHTTFLAFHSDGAMSSAQAELQHRSLNGKADVGHLVCHPLALYVHDLARHQALCAHRLADLAHHLRAPVASGPVAPAAQPAQASPRPMTLQLGQAAVLPAMQQRSMQARRGPAPARLRSAATPRRLSKQPLHPQPCSGRACRRAGAPHPHDALGSHAARLPRHVLKRERQQRVPRKDGHLLAIHLRTRNSQARRRRPLQPCLTAQRASGLVLKRAPNC